MAAKKSTTKASKTSSKPKATTASKTSSKSKTAKSTKTAPKTKVKAASSKATSAASKKVTPKTNTKTTAKTTNKKAPTKKAPTKKAAPKKSTTKKSVSKTSTTSKTVDFMTDIIKQATKAQKNAQNQTKALIKELNNLDKQHAQLTKKQSTAKGKSWQTIEGQISKLKTQITTTRTALLNSENNEDKIATLVEVCEQLNSRATPSSYITSAPTKPSLVQNSTSPYAEKTSSTSKQKQESFLDEDDYPDEEDLDIDDEVEEEMGFVFGDDDELQDDEMGR